MRLTKLSTNGLLTEIEESCHVQTDLPMLLPSRRHSRGVLSCV